MNISTSNNISNIVLSVSKNILSKKEINIKQILTNTAISLGIKFAISKLLNKRSKTLELEKLILIGGFVFITSKYYIKKYE
ncbi:MAG: hypothetical protein COA66_07860 [Arcobacter sp.]|nr:MAG: hypothetical protein COA66_07860 [Arcobacter sp.]